MSQNKTTVYIAGKITGDPNYKKKFAAARRELAAAGFIVLDPSVLPSTGFEYAAYIRISAAMMDECDVVCFWRIGKKVTERGANTPAHKCGI